MRNRGDSVYCDWMPWSHAGAGFGRLAHVSATGASLYIDDGRPTPDRFARTLENVRTVRRRDTHYVGAPVARIFSRSMYGARRRAVLRLLHAIREVYMGSAADGAVDLRAFAGAGHP